MITKIFLFFYYKLKFILAIIGRVIIVLFRRKQSIELLRLEYFDEHLFENSYIILQYRFRNALWYRFGKHNTLENEIKIFNLTNFEKDFDFVVYGLFRKKVYRLKFEPKLSLNTESFKTELLIDSFELNEQPVLSFPEFTISFLVPKVQLLPIEIKRKNITVQSNIYNQTDFI